MEELRVSMVQSMKDQLKKIDKMEAGSKEKESEVENFCKIFNLELAMEKIDMDWNKELEKLTVEREKLNVTDQKNDADIQLEKQKMNLEADKLEFEREKFEATKEKNDADIQINKERNDIDREKNSIDRERNERQAKDGFRDKVIEMGFQMFMYGVEVIAINQFCNDWRTFEKTDMVVSKADRITSAVKKMFDFKKK